MRSSKGSSKKEPKFYDSPEFKALDAEWKKKLADSGFEDLEDAQENLTAPNNRTVAFQNRDLILDFFVKLDHYLTNTKDKIKPEHRKILELYAKGTYVSGKNGIIEQTGYSKRGIEYVIARYKKIVLDLKPDNGQEG